MLCVFGFRSTRFARAAPGGELLLQVDAGPDHLRELREVIYPLKPERPGQPRAPAGFEHLASDTYAPDPTSTAPPHRRPAGDDAPTSTAPAPEDAPASTALVALTMTVDVRLARYRRHPAEAKPQRQSRTCSARST